MHSATEEFGFKFFNQIQERDKALTLNVAACQLIKIPGIKWVFYESSCTIFESCLNFGMHVEGEILHDKLLFSTG